MIRKKVDDNKVEKKKERENREINKEKAKKVKK